MTTENYIQKVINEYSSGIAREHAYRPAFKDFIESLGEVRAVNDPSRSQHGNPDFVFLRSSNQNIISGYAETKDITANLANFEGSEQLRRYLGYPNLILTNYLDFRFYRNGVKYQSIEVARIAGSQITPMYDNFTLLEHELKSFLASPPERITNGKRLAEIMGGKALRIRENIKLYLKHEGNEKNIELEKMFNVLKQLLVHDLTTDKFADMFAQTLVYGLFVARYHDQSPDNFSRQEARDLVPPSNPFLQRFFDHIVGPQFDKRLAYIVDELCAVFAVADIRQIIMRHYNLFGEVSGRDPIIHFYEDFLKEYDPKQKKEMGAYYTPVEVVQFMVRAVDNLLKKDFQLTKGLADTTMIRQDVVVSGRKEKLQVHKVQVLDPAVGTATFLNELIKFIYEKNFKGQEGRWPSYVDSDLLPRIVGFELMMAPYTIAHMKLSMTLIETGYKNFSQRVGIYLTNTLEHGVVEHGDLFSGFGLLETITEEGHVANEIKINRPIMVVIGNPPYSGETNNKGLFETELDAYKQEPGGNGKLQERNTKWINDDYVKFIRFAEATVDKNGEGIVAYITNHSYIDNPTFRGMRWHLCKTFDEVYILDLHGNAKKNERTPDGGKDENVFDIEQGVAIFIGYKRKSSKKKSIATVYKYDLYGTRQHKFDMLDKFEIDTVPWEKIELDTKNYNFIVSDKELQEEYDKGFIITELFNFYSVGIVTARDKMSIQLKSEQVEEVIKDFHNLEIEELRSKYKLGKDVRDWTVKGAKEDVQLDDGVITDISYRPFDNRKTYYTGRSRGFHCYPRNTVMKNFINSENVGLATTRQQKATQYKPALVHSNIVESTYISNKTSEITYSFPLYYFDTFGKNANFNEPTYKKITKGFKKQTAPEDILDYIYAVLYSQKYQLKYKAQLKKEFPRIPMPKDELTFWELVSLGTKLRKLHLMVDNSSDEFITSFTVSGSDIVDKYELRDKKVYINDTQYFDGISDEVWSFEVGCYKPVQAWLKDRIGKKLDNADLDHYQKIIKVISETVRVMQEIDNVLILK